MLSPTARPPLISKLPAHSRLPCFRSSHFSFPSAFASVRTSSARLAFNLSAFLFPLDLHPPSGTSACSPSVARSRLFAFRPVSQAQFAFPAASLSLASFRRFPFPSGTRRHFPAPYSFEPSALPSPLFSIPFPGCRYRSLFAPYPTPCEVFAVASRHTTIMIIL